MNADELARQLHAADREGAVLTACLILGLEATSLSRRVYNLAGDDGEPPIRVEVYKAELAVKRRAQEETRKRLWDAAVRGDLALGPE